MHPNRDFKAQRERCRKQSQAKDSKAPTKITGIPKKIILTYDTVVKAGAKVRRIPPTLHRRARESPVPRAEQSPERVGSFAAPAVTGCRRVRARQGGEQVVRVRLRRFAGRPHPGLSDTARPAGCPCIPRAALLPALPDALDGSTPQETAQTHKRLILEYAVDYYPALKTKARDLAAPSPRTPPSLPY